MSFLVFWSDNPMSATATESSLHFSGKAVTAWGGLALMQRMLGAIGFRCAFRAT